MLHIWTRGALLLMINNHGVRFSKFGLSGPKFGPIWPKFGRLTQSLSFWATDFIFVSKEPYCNWKTSIGLDFKNLVYQTKNLARFGPNLAIWVNPFNSSNIISDYKLKIEEYHLSSVRDFSKFYKDIEKLNISAFRERLNLKIQEKIILFFHSYWYSTRL